MKKRRNESEKGRAIAKLIMEQYQPKTQEDMQIALKDVFSPIFEAMLQGEMDNYLRYSSMIIAEGNLQPSEWLYGENRPDFRSARSPSASHGTRIYLRAPVVPKRTRDVEDREQGTGNMYARSAQPRILPRRLMTSPRIRAVRREHLQHHRPGDGRSQHCGASPETLLPLLVRRLPVCLCTQGL